ncbi:YjzC family protein [Brevibacillus dissolubilis]|uniref:YjzC family protein n=1 Tax=Brevibacillus dissolubilis TaxID=1844116 RepID=UPI001115DF51|nr:YjzC family protein [Brevibacillus dissolubilis]
MGEQSRFKPGDKAPNDGHYMEISENGPGAGIIDPLHVELQKGQHFPATRNKNRVWVRA